MDNFLSIVTVAALGVIGNIIYFKYQIKKESNKEILKKRLTDLLLPLFIALTHDEINLAWTIKYDDPGDYHSGTPRRLFNKLKDIIEHNIYLADDELHMACLTFLKWAALCDENERYQDIMNGKSLDEIDFENFKNVIYERYNAERKKYIS